MITEMIQIPKLGGYLQKIIKKTKTKNRADLSGLIEIKDYQDYSRLGSVLLGTQKS